MTYYLPPIIKICLLLIFCNSFVFAFTKPNSSTTKITKASFNLGHTESFSSFVGVIKPRDIPVRGGYDTMDSALSMNAFRVITKIAPRLGIFTSTALYFSPALAVLKAVRASSLGDLNPIPLGIMAIASVSWLAYGLASRDPFVALSNIVGCIASIAYVIGILPLMGKNGGRQLRTMQTIVISGAAGCLCLWTALVLSNLPSPTACSTLGLFASGIFIVLSGSPLSSIGEVISKKDASTILTPFMFAQLINTFLWSIYGLTIKDQFVWGPNIMVRCLCMK